LSYYNPHDLDSFDGGHPQIEQHPYQQRKHLLNTLVY